VELRSAFDAIGDVTLVYVMADEQVNEKTRRFIDENGLRDRVRFVADPDSRSIDRLGLRLADPEPMEAGVPHPATYVLDRDGVVRFVDVRTDYHIWLDPQLLVDALARVR
jgi:peroxiredoxin